MIVTRTNNTSSSLAAWSATAHAKLLDEQNIGLYTMTERFKGDLIERLAQVTFYKSRVFKNYRQNFIAIKVCDPSIEEFISDDCRKLYDVCESNDIHVVHTKTGVIFRIYK
jgi:hypothetical protein